MNNRGACAFFCHLSAHYLCFEALGLMACSHRSLLCIFSEHFLWCYVIWCMWHETYRVAQTMLLKGVIVQLQPTWYYHLRLLMCHVLTGVSCTYLENLGGDLNWTVALNMFQQMDLTDRQTDRQTDAQTPIEPQEFQKSTPHLYNQLNLTSRSCRTQCLYFISLGEVSLVAITPAGMAVSHTVPRSARSCVNNSKAAHLTGQGKTTRKLDSCHHPRGQEL